MNISFDLDLTLIPHNHEFETEKRNFLQMICRVEKIRTGTIELFKQLQQQGHIISIYTSSHRIPFRVYFNFRTYGLKIRKIVSFNENQIVLKKLGVDVAKYPPAYSFDLHIDDSESIGMDGNKLNFKTLIIKPNDLNWSDTIKQHIQSIG